MHEYCPVSSDHLTLLLCSAGCVWNVSCCLLGLLRRQAAPSILWQLEKIEQENKSESFNLLFVTRIKGHNGSFVTLGAEMIEIKPLLSVSQYNILYCSDSGEIITSSDTSRSIISWSLLQIVQQLNQSCKSDWFSPMCIQRAFRMLNANSHFSSTHPHIVQPLPWILSMMVILSSRVILVICIFTWGWFSSLYWKGSHRIFLQSGRDSVLAVGSANDRSSPLANYSVSAVLAADRTPIDQIPQTQINQAIFWPEKRWIWAKADT